MIPETIRKAVLRAIDEDGSQDSVAITMADIFSCFEKMNAIRWQVSLMLQCLLTEGLIYQTKEGLKLTAKGRNSLTLSE